MNQIDLEFKLMKLLQIPKNTTKAVITIQANEFIEVDLTLACDPEDVPEDAESRPTTTKHFELREIKKSYCGGFIFYANGHPVECGDRCNADEFWQCSGCNADELKEIKS